jgi:hypothetical protein
MNKQEIYMRISPQALHTELAIYPDKIADQKAAVRSAKKNFEDLDQERAVRELEIMSDITGDSDPSTGKARFSNDKARQAELAKRVKVDPEYQAALRQSKDAEMGLNQAQDELERLENKFRSCRYRAELAAAEFRFWGGMEQEENLHNPYAHNAKQAY